MPAICVVCFFSCFVFFLFSYERISYSTVFTICCGLSFAFFSFFFFVYVQIDGENETCGAVSRAVSLKLFSRS